MVKEGQQLLAGSSRIGDRSHENGNRNYRADSRYVKALYVVKGDSVNPDEVLIEIGMA